MRRALFLLSKMILSSFVFVLIGGIIFVLIGGITWIGLNIAIELWHVFGWKTLIVLVIYAVIIWSAWYRVVHD